MDLMVILLTAYALVGAGVCVGCICQFPDDPSKIQLFAAAICGGILWPALWAMKITQRLL